MTKFYTRKRGFRNKDWVCTKTIKAYVPISVGKNVEIEKESYQIEEVAYLIQGDELIVQVYLEAK